MTSSVDTLNEDEVTIQLKSMELDHAFRMKKAELEYEEEKAQRKHENKAETRKWLMRLIQLAVILVMILLGISDAWKYLPGLISGALGTASAGVVAFAMI